MWKQKKMMILIFPDRFRIKFGISQKLEENRNLDSLFLMNLAAFVNMLMPTKGWL